MIETIHRKNRLQHAEIIDFLNNHFDYDFYITEQNTRFYITDSFSFKLLLRSSDPIYFIEEKGEIAGIILVWRSFGGDKKRYYVKINAISNQIAKKLLTVLLWNFDKDLYIKMRKDSSYINTFKSSGFRFEGGRGSQILLKRKYIKKLEEDYVGFIRD